MKKILLVVVLLSFPLVFASAQQHEISAGLTASLFTDFGSYTDFPLGLELEYYYQLPKESFGRRWSHYASFGIRSGILPQGGNGFPREFLLSMPLQIPLNLGLEYHISPWKRVGFIVEFAGGLNFNIHSGGVVSPLWVFNTGLGMDFLFTDLLGLKFLARFGGEGYGSDVWFGPGLSILFFWRI